MVALGLEEMRAVEVAVQAIEEDEERCGRWAVAPYLNENKVSTAEKG